MRYLFLYLSLSYSSPIWSQSDTSGIAFIDFVTLSLLYNNADQCFNHSRNSKINISAHYGFGCGVKIFNNVYASLSVGWGSYDYATKDTEVYRYQRIQGSQNNQPYIYSIEIEDTVFTKLQKEYVMHGLGIKVKKNIHSKIAIWINPQMVFFRSYSHFKHSTDVIISKTNQAVPYEISTVDHSSKNPFYYLNISKIETESGMQLLPKIQLEAEYKLFNNVCLYTSLGIMASPNRFNSLKQGLPFLPDYGFGLRIR